MQRVRLVILEHVRRSDRHFDLLLEPPGPAQDRERLWAARFVPRWPPTDRPSRSALIPLPPHRRAYLTHQGDIGHGRGFVIRRDAGHALPLLWCPHRIDLAIRTPQWRGRMEAHRRGDGWLAGWDPACTASP